MVGAEFPKKLMRLSIRSRVLPIVYVLEDKMGYTLVVALDRR